MNEDKHYDYLLNEYLNKCDKEDEELEAQEEQDLRDYQDYLDDYDDSEFEPEIFEVWNRRIR